MRKYNLNARQRWRHRLWFHQYKNYVNRCIRNDDLWLGRFYITIEQDDMEWFDDGSGGLMHALIIMHDRKTGRELARWYNGLDMDWLFWRDFNNFIVEYCDVWHEQPDIRFNRIDYRKRKNRK